MSTTLKLHFEKVLNWLKIYGINAQAVVFKAFAYSTELTLSYTAIL